MRSFLLATTLSLVAAHGDIPLNPLLGEGGYPDCRQTVPVSQLTDNIEENAKTLVCDQQKDGDDQILVGCIGDSITAGVHSSGGNHTYPGQLQIMLDTKYPGKYKVTNLGACGSTMMKGANSPYWQRPQYKTLTTNKWDILIIMLGTNDAKDAASHGPPNWPHNCTKDGMTLDLACPFAEDYASMVTLARTLGTTAGTPPTIYSAIPPPLMQKDSIGANNTVINDVYPALVPAINAANKLGTPVIDIFSAMGGNPNWRKDFPGSCTLETAKTWKPCGWWCDAQSCDQCHPDDVGYNVMAAAMMKGIGL
jgi:lysophospholipase L1-like esterase